MKRIKLLWLVAAAFMGMGGAFAGKKWNAICEDHQQYIYYPGIGYWPVSSTYVCFKETNDVCTYYLSSYVPEVYTICQYGQYRESR